MEAVTMTALVNALAPFVWVVGAVIAIVNRVKSKTEWAGHWYTVLAVAATIALGLVSKYLFVMPELVRDCAVLTILGLNAAGFFDIAEILGGQPTAALSEPMKLMSTERVGFSDESGT